MNSLCALLVVFSIATLSNGYTVNILSSVATLSSVTDCRANIVDTMEIEIEEGETEFTREIRTVKAGYFQFLSAPIDVISNEVTVLDSSTSSSSSSLTFVGFFSFLILSLLKRVTWTIEPFVGVANFTFDYPATYFVRQLLTPEDNLDHIVGWEPDYELNRPAVANYKIIFGSQITTSDINQADPNPTPVVTSTVDNSITWIRNEPSVGVTYYVLFRYNGGGTCPVSDYDDGFIDIDTSALRDGINSIVQAIIIASVIFFVCCVVLPIILVILCCCGIIGGSAAVAASTA